MLTIYDVRSDFQRAKSGGNSPRLTVSEYKDVPFRAYMIDFSEYRDTSRWVSVPRVRKFQLARRSNRIGDGWFTLGYYATLEKAIAAAEAYDKL